MGKLVDLAGQRFGKWLVLSKGESDSKGARWNCKCECGTKRLVRSDGLREGKSKSCGCTREGNVIHGHNRNSGRSPTYQSWRHMLRRCDDPNHRQYHLYGGRGVSVCEAWRDFSRFLLDMGERPEGRTLDRIDSNGNYDPGNCRWSTPKEQANNMSRNRIIEYNGRKQTMSQWADELGIKYVTLNCRMHRGWSVERALKTK